MDVFLQRRRLLATGAALEATAGLPVLGPVAVASAATPTPAATTSDEFDRLRAAWSDILTGGAKVDPADPDYAAALAGLDAAADAAIAGYDHSATPAGVYTDLPFGPVEHASLSYYRIRDTALAWATVGSKHYQSPTVAAGLTAALALLAAGFYHPAAPEVGSCCRAPRRPGPRPTAASGSSPTRPRCKRSGPRSWT